MSQPTGVHERLREGDGTIVRIFDHPVTVNEVHALIIGCSGLLVATSVEPLSSLLTVLLIAYALGGQPAFASMAHDDPEYVRAIGLKMIKHEPWWFLVTFIPSILIGGLI